MGPVGIICEYNPFHNGHAAQLRRIREDFGSETEIVCLMSGNYVQRGEPAIFPKALRAQAAVLLGADLVLELPLTAALSSAEGFAARGVEILTALGCEGLSFGSECGDRNILMSTAEANLDLRFDNLVRERLSNGCSYPKARQLALEELGAGRGVSAPNDILAVEYCKAILRQGSPMEPLPICRPGDYHAEELDLSAPSATALRAALVGSVRRDGHQPPAVSAPAAAHGLSRDSAPTHLRRDEPCSSGIRYECNLPESNPNAEVLQADKHGLSLQTHSELLRWQDAVPSCLHHLYASAPIHTMAAGERAVLAILRTLPEDAYRDLPFGAEGLWSKLLKNVRTGSSVEEILFATKSKRYTLSRLRRMLLCAILGLTEADLKRKPPYVRILAFNDRGRALLRRSREGLQLCNAGQTPQDPGYYALETRAGDLYSLFCTEAARPGGEEARQRVSYLPRPCTGTEKEE